MHDDMKPAQTFAPRLDTRILRHMMHETVDLLDASSDYTDEACESTDAAMTLTRIDWMLMGIFTWLTREMRLDGDTKSSSTLGKPISVLGIDQDALSDELRTFAKAVDRLHERVCQLDTLVDQRVAYRAKHPQHAAPALRTGKVLHIFGDPAPDAARENPVGQSRQRLRTALSGL